MHVVAAAVAGGISGGEGWLELGELGLAFVLSALIGLEREFRQKSAGLRTHTLVGVGAALFMLVSKYGFSDVLESGRIVLDPSRVAAQIVSGIGFLGAGVIFVRRDAVRGLTTAAVVWVTAAVGMACGAGLPVLAIAVTFADFLVAFGLTPLSRRLPASPSATSELRLVYQNGRGVLRGVLEVCTGLGFTVSRVSSGGPVDGFAGSVPVPAEDETSTSKVWPPVVAVLLEVSGRGSVAALAARLHDVDGVLAVHAADVNALTD